MDTLRTISTWNVDHACTYVPKYSTDNLRLSLARHRAVQKSNRNLGAWKLGNTNLESCKICKSINCEATSRATFEDEEEEETSKMEREACSFSVERDTEEEDGMALCMDPLDSLVHLLRSKRNRSLPRTETELTQLRGFVPFDFEGTDLSRKEDTLQGWAEKSVWSMVCAMELGLISSQNNVLFDAMPDQRSYVNVASAAVPKSLSLIDNSSVSAASKSSRIIRMKSRRRKKRSSKCASRSKSESPFIQSKEVKENFCKTRRSHDSTTTDNDLNTVDKFWRYQKRRHESSKNAEQFPSGETRNDDPSVSAGYRDSVAAKRDDNDNLPNQSNHTSNILPTQVNIPQTGTSSREVKSPCRNDASNFASRDYDRSEGTDGWTKRTDFDTSPTKPVNVQQKRMNEDCDEDERLRYSREDRDAYVSSTIDDHQDNISIEMESEQSEKEQSEKEQSENEDLALEESASLDEAESSNFGAAHSSNFGAAHSSNFGDARPSSFNEATTTTTKPMRKVAKSGVTRKKGYRWSDGSYELRRVTRGSMKVSKDLFVGKLVWGYYSGWWPGENFKILFFLFSFYLNSVRKKED
ncbi:hypothetical protein WN51_14086 [Melipona quadrifasciata]|uniref:Uncharacterized protein n=1 Tax=Melipona quadrifasciata TaxID=166423 RepID=A0A0M9A0R3_9HYME|nr:hypothetical protein WN51_14086 [Melipona quadrifasciata]